MEPFACARGDLFLPIHGEGGSFPPHAARERISSASDRGISRTLTAASLETTTVPSGLVEALVEAGAHTPDLPGATSAKSPRDSAHRRYDFIVVDERRPVARSTSDVVYLVVIEEISTCDATSRAHSSTERRRESYHDSRSTARSTAISHSLCEEATPHPSGTAAATTRVLVSARRLTRRRRGAPVPVRDTAVTERGVQPETTSATMGSDHLELLDGLTTSILMRAS